MLVTLIIIGILSAIALPSFLNQSTKALQSEAKTNVGVMNRAQQSYYLENQKFADDTGGTTAIDKLGIGIKDSTNYTYAATAITAIATNVANKAQAQKPKLKGYAGGVFTSAELTQAILCEVKTAAMTIPEDPDSATTCDPTQDPMN